jgi:hypothetical protein
MQTSDLTPSVYQLRVVIQGLSPLIWRRRLIRSHMSLATLHTTLQTVLAWSAVYLHCFRLHGQEYGSTRLGGPSFDTDPRQVPLAALRLHRGERFTYVCNFIDHWVCDLRLEAMLPLHPRRLHPVCTGGKRAAPPEDCGGPGAYMQLVDRRHPPTEAMCVFATALTPLLEVDEHTPMRQVTGTLRPSERQSNNSTCTSSSSLSALIVDRSIASCAP